MSLERAIRRFKKKYILSGKCWIWTAAKDSQGYGRFRDENMELTGAHQFSFKIHGGASAVNNVLHNCDTPSCVNPEHLFDGTQDENVKDMDAKGRRRHGDHRGEKHARHKLKDAEVFEIRKMKAEGFLLREIAEKFSITIQSVWSIVNGKTWKHLI